MHYDSNIMFSDVQMAVVGTHLASQNAMHCICMSALLMIYVYNAIISSYGFGLSQTKINEFDRIYFVFIFVRVRCSLIYFAIHN